MSKATELLERMTPVEYCEEDTTLARDSKKLLGYSLLGKIDRQLKLRAALDELGVSPFTDESVERYKQAVLALANLQAKNGRAISIMSWLGVALTLICFGPALLGWFISWKVGFASVAGLVAGCVLIDVTDGKTIKGQAEWQVNPLVGYRSPVPKSVLQLAVGLKRRLSRVELTVHELVQAERVLDPFLAARLGETTYFIAVWDEPQFDAQSL